MSECIYCEDTLQEDDSDFSHWEKCPSHPARQMVIKLEKELAEARAENAKLKLGILPNAANHEPCDMCQNFYEKFRSTCEGCCHNYQNRYELKKTKGGK